MKKYPDSAEILEKIINNYLKLWDKKSAMKILDNFAANYSEKEWYKNFIIATRELINKSK